MKYSEKLSLVKLMIFTSLSFGLYTLYWYPRTWRQLKEEYAETGMIGLRTVGLLVPLLNLFLMYDTAKYLAGHCKDKVKFRWNASQVIVLIILLGFVGRWLLNVFEFPFEFIIVSFIASSPLLLMQNTLNLYLGKTEKKHLPLKPVERGDIIIGIIAVLMWTALIIVRLV